MPYVPFTSALARYHRTKNQLILPFGEPLRAFSQVPLPFTGKPADPLHELLNRQPKKFPVGWPKMLARDGPNWRSMHYARWSEMRRGKGLPDFVKDQNPDPKPARKLTQSVRFDDAQRREA